MRAPIENRSHHRLYRRWVSIKKNCDDRWLDFDHFVWWFEDMMFVENLGRLPYEFLWISKLDKTAPYSAANCKLRARSRFAPKFLPRIPDREDIISIRALAKGDETWRYSCSQIGLIVGMPKNQVYRIAIGEDGCQLNYVSSPVEKNWNLLNTHAKSEKLRAIYGW